ncbi:glutathione S-transferase family protein [Thalassobaculum salexigens]|uniref:glutathione S-transferase family protein n=1 Tax=Thalassobaculum salexigens TaxID=455360 RepID=UPI00248E6754|nr:glutathione S-transferase family protein [Thalassobaculum salexigens]
MTHVLYWSGRAGSLAPLCLLIEGGVPHETVQVDTSRRAHKTADYLRDVHPLGTVPALRLPDGQVILESGAMVLHLAELAPSLAPAAGSADRAMFLNWVAYGAGSLYPAYQRVYHTDHIVPDEAGRPAAREAAVVALDRCWDVVEAALEAGRPGLFGDRPGAADVYLAMLALWHPAPERLAAACPKVRAMKDAVWALPSMRQALAVHGLETA